MSAVQAFAGAPAELVPSTGERVEVCGLSRAAWAHVLAEMVRARPETYVVYLPTALEAEDFVRDLEFFWPEGAAAGAVLLLPGYEVKPFGGESPATDLVFARLWALYNLLSEQQPLVVVAPAAGVLQLCLPREALAEAVELVEAGQEVDREALLARLVRAGYFSTALVQDQGDFSVRGGILDLYPPGQSQPVRAEFFGDFVESLRSFGTLDQRSVEQLRELVVLPASEIIYEPERARQALAAFRALADEAGWPGPLCAPVEEGLAGEEFFSGLESYLPLFYDHLSPVEAYAGPEAVRIVFEPERWREAAAAHLDRLEDHLARLGDEDRPHLPLERLSQTPEEFEASLAGRRVIQVKELALLSPDRPRKSYYFRLETNQDLRALIDRAKASAGLLAPLAARVKNWLGQGFEVVLACHTQEQARRLAGLLENYSLYPGLDLEPRPSPARSGGGFRLRVGFLSAGFVLESWGRAFVTEDELFGPKRRVIRRAAVEVKGVHLSSFQDLAVGDFVVHTEHGVGQYLGLVKMESEGLANDYLDLAYQGGDKLYVPVDRFEAVQKYVGPDGRAPRLDKLGGRRWEQAKARVTASLREMAQELLQLYAARQVKKGHAFSPPDSYFREFEAAFEYEETPDQLAAIGEVLTDMESPRPMDRLVCGDVGFGKTEVALRAAFKTVLEGKQVGLLVPTTVLAEQHYETFAARLKNYPVEVEALSRFKTRSEQGDILNRLATGRVDVVIGTHRLLQRDVKFKDLGLVILDEEHRFGVADKEKLKKLRTEVDVLTLSATPIPRTMNMSLSGLRDLSVIETPPQDRYAIKTYLLRYDQRTICEAIARELDRGGQVFFVHNRVRDIQAVARRLQKLMPLVRFGVAHGQMRERDLEEVMLCFLRREIDVLVTTAIIESGLDIPSANTIIINNADRFGLAEIYQLRGRVGRSDVQAYAYLLVASESNLTREARKRLKALLDFSELGAGFKIALHDLQIRGAGSLLGTAQSGHVAAVGYEMYVQLMEKTIREIKGEPLAEEVEPEMVLNLPAYIPETYVPDTEQRLVHYRRLSSSRTAEDLADLAAELKDRYGPLPDEVQNLFEIMELKWLLKRAGAKKLEMGEGGTTLTFVEDGRADPDKVLALVAAQPDRARLSPEGRLFLGLSGLTGPEGLDRAKNILQELT